jgi:hypothetical protein
MYNETRLINYCVSQLVCSNRVTALELNTYTTK